MTTALILTTYNDAKTIKPFIESVLDQTRRPDEVIILDGGSIDGTGCGIPAAWWFRVDPTCNIRHYPSPVARGRNIAAQMAKADILLITNADCVLLQDFVEKMAGAIEAGAVSAYCDTVAIADNLFEYVAAEATLPSRQMPSARGLAIRRDEFIRLGGFPEITLTAEDTAFVKLISPVHVKTAVYWRPRGTFRAIMKQAYRYSKGDAISRLNGWMHLRIAAKYILILAVLVLTSFHPFAIGASVCCLCLYLGSRSGSPVTWHGRRGTA